MVIDEDGSVVETGDVYTIFANPRHPYTVGLMDSLPKLVGAGVRCSISTDDPAMFDTDPVGARSAARGHKLFRTASDPNEVSIAVVGKYAEHKDAYKSIYEALDHAGVGRIDRRADRGRDVHAAVQGTPADPVAAGHPPGRLQSFFLTRVRGSLHSSRAPAAPWRGAG